jgi:hypothetical protein
MMIAKIVSVNMDTLRVDVQPLVRRPSVKRHNVEITYTSLPTLFDVPLAFPRSSVAMITHKVAVGDIVEIRFAQHSLDEILSGDSLDEITAQDVRKHALQDAVAVPISFGPVHATSEGADYEIIAADVRIGNPSVSQFLVREDLQDVMDTMIGQINAALLAISTNVAYTPVSNVIVPTTVNLKGS